MMEMEQILVMFVVYENIGGSWSQIGQDINERF